MLTRNLVFAALVASAASSFAQAAPSAQSPQGNPPYTPACGDPTVELQVKTDRRPHPAALEPGQAQVYFIEKDEGTLLDPTTKLGTDGKWVGATHGDSWFSLQVSPGVHHFCAITNSYQGPLSALAHIAAVPGQVYYLEFRNLVLSRGSAGLWNAVSLAPLDSDEGAMLVSEDPMTMAREKN